MRNLIFIVLAGLLAGCASTKEDSAVAKNDAIEDYLIVSELEKLDSIRTNSNQRYQTVTEKYVIVEDRRNTYLMAFRQRCRELNDNLTITPDIRRDNNVIRAKFDTYRGCRIEALYSLNDGQAKELQELGERVDQ